ncbi:Protein CBG00758 [Caenorhabditis briggsae]|nr:Protein CBG00758 [Caenorhabditis briggsae]ULT86355.1 hypothetical protein L3Y34_006203 [Caenorhabditis briggsae]UMM32117.1 hypothetical protein L5515_006034 [Caenorhabditis briggsae]CAP22124.1 Protein CBG00758 [Caenorhabditis briggsae]
MTFWIITIFVIAISSSTSHGASLATEESKDHNCTLGDGLKAISCVFKMQDFLEKVEDLNLDNKAETANFKSSCDSLRECFTSLDCKTSSTDQETSDISGMIKTYCDTIVYISTDFVECSDKLEDKSSQCFEDWDPFPEDVSKETDPVKKKEKRKLACKNFFGKDNCLKHEITTMCSEEEWKGFKNHFISLSNMTRQCDFHEL